MIAASALRSTSEPQRPRALKTASREIFAKRGSASRRRAADAFVASRENACIYEKSRQDRQSLQTDPVGYEDDLNLYAYVRNDPLNNTDPTGRQMESFFDGLGDVRACGNDQGCINARVNSRAQGAALVAAGAATLAIPGPEDLIIAGIAGRTVWGLANAPRGFAIERALGANLPQAFPAIDRFDRATGLATSIKSIDLGARSYQDANRLGRTIDRHVDRLANFRGASHGGTTVRGDEITGRRLELAVPEGMTDAQRGAIEAATARAAERDVEIVLRVVR